MDKLKMQTANKADREFQEVSRDVSQRRDGSNYWI